MIISVDRDESFVINSTPFSWLIWHQNKSRCNRVLTSMLITVVEPIHTLDYK